MESAAMSSIIVLNFIRITMWCLMYAVYSTHIYVCPYFNEFILFFNIWYVTSVFFQMVWWIKEWLFLSAPFACLFDLQCICFLLYMLHIVLSINTRTLSTIFILFSFSRLWLVVNCPIYRLGWRFPEISNQTIISCDTLIFFNLGLTLYINFY